MLFPYFQTLEGFNFQIYLVMAMAMEKKKNAILMMTNHFVELLKQLEERFVNVQIGLLEKQLIQLLEGEDVNVKLARMELVNVMHQLQNVMHGI